jgi:hypothetical protein
LGFALNVWSSTHVVKTLTTDLFDLTSIDLQLARTSLRPTDGKVLHILVIPIDITFVTSSFTRHVDASRYLSNHLSQLQVCTPSMAVRGDPVLQHTSGDYAGVVSQKGSAPATDGSKKRVLN